MKKLAILLAVVVVLIVASEAVKPTESTKSHNEKALKSAARGGNAKHDGKVNSGGFTYLGSWKVPRNRDNSQTDFHLSSEKVKWEDAFHICQDELDGRLLSIESQGEEAQVTKYLEGYTLDYIWTCGQYDQDQRKWYWITNRQVLEYSNWKTGITHNTGNAFRLAYYYALKPNWQSLPKSNLNRFVCELDQVHELKPCFKTKNIVIVLDGSESIKPPNFELARVFVAKLAHAFTVNEASRFGLVVYSDTATIEIPFNSNLTAGDIDKKIRKMPYPNNNTFTHFGIDEAFKFLKPIPVEYPRIMVLITDGLSNEPTKTRASANAVIQAGIQTFSVGIGGYSLQELLMVANNDASRVHTTLTYDILISQLVPLGHQLCDTKE